ncbi:MAG: NAD(P)-dependent oxidoreductase [Betaproteobacteria bacterium]
MTAASIGFIGLGRMGRPMVGHIAARGHQVMVFDTNPSACQDFPAESIASSPREIAEHCEVIFSCVATTDAYDQVAIGEQGLRDGRAVRTYVHLGTTGAAHIRGLSQTLARSGIATVDAPISGGVIGAVNGTLATIASGAPSALTLARPFIECYSRAVFDFGPQPGTAQAVKVINNNISSTNLMVAIEGLTLGLRAGADPGMLADLIAAGTGSSLANDVMVRNHVVTRDFAWGGAMQIILKDLRAWKSLAEELQADCPINRAACERFIAAIEQLGPSEDITGVAKFIEQQEGVVLRSQVKTNA